MNARGCAAVPPAAAAPTSRSGMTTSPRNASALRRPRPHTLTCAGVSNWRRAVAASHWVAGVCVLRFASTGASRSHEAPYAVAKNCNSAKEYSGHTTMQTPSNPPPCHAVPARRVWLNKGRTRMGVARRTRACRSEPTLTALNATSSCHAGAGRPGASAVRRTCPSQRSTQYTSPRARARSPVALPPTPGAPSACGLGNLKGLGPRWPAHAPGPERKRAAPPVRSSASAAGAAPRRGLPRASAQDSSSPCPPHGSYISSPYPPRCRCMSATWQLRVERCPWAQAAGAARHTRVRMAHLSDLQHVEDPQPELRGGEKGV